MEFRHNTLVATMDGWDLKRHPSIVDVLFLWKRFALWHSSKASRVNAIGCVEGSNHRIWVTTCINVQHCGSIWFNTCLLNHCQEHCHAKIPKSEFPCFSSWAFSTSSNSCSKSRSKEVPSAWRDVVKTLWPAVNERRRKQTANHVAGQLHSLHLDQPKASLPIFSPSEPIVLKDCLPCCFHNWATMVVSFHSSCCTMLFPQLCCSSQPAGELFKCILHNTLCFNKTVWVVVIFQRKVALRSRSFSSWFHQCQ